MVKTTRKPKKYDGDIATKKRNAVLSKSYLTRNQKQLISKSSSVKEKCTNSNVVSNSNQNKSAKTDSNVSKLDTQIMKNILDNLNPSQNNVFRKTAEKLKECKACSVVIKQKDINFVTNNRKLSKKSLVQKRDARCNKFNSIQVKPSNVELNDSNLIIQSDKTHLSNSCASKKAKIDKISTKFSSPQKLNDTKNKKLPDMQIQDICANTIEIKLSTELKHSENSKSSLNDENSSQNVSGIYSQAGKNVHLKDLRIICQKLDISNYKSNCVKNTLNTNNEEESVHFKQNKTMIKNEINSASHLNNTTNDSDNLSDRLDIYKNASLEEAVTTEEKLNKIKSENKVYSIASSSLSVVRRNIHESLEIDKTEIISSEGTIENESVTMKSALQRKYLRSTSWIKDYDEELPQFESNANFAVPEALSMNKRTWCVLS